MHTREAIILFVNDEVLEQTSKPLPGYFAVRGYRHVNRRIAERLAALRAHGVDLIVASGRADAGTAAMYGASHVFAQQGDSFGERLALAIENAFSLGYERVVAVGNDCPTITASDVRAALRRLRDGASYVGAPSADGGVFLVGASRDGFDHQRFTPLPWCTRQLCQSLLALPGAQALPVVKEDFDSWNSPHALEALARLFGGSTCSTPHIPTTPLQSQRRRKALMRPYLPAPPY